MSLRIFNLNNSEHTLQKQIVSGISKRSVFCVTLHPITDKQKATTKKMSVIAIRTEAMRRKFTPHYRSHISQILNFQLAHQLVTNYNPRVCQKYKGSILHMNTMLRVKFHALNI